MCNHVTIIIGIMSAKPFLPFFQNLFLCASFVKILLFVQENGADKPIFITVKSILSKPFPLLLMYMQVKSNPSFPTGASEGTDWIYTQNTTISIPPTPSLVCGHNSMHFAVLYIHVFVHYTLLFGSSH